MKDPIHNAYEIYMDTLAVLGLSSSIVDNFYAGGYFVGITDSPHEVESTFPQDHQDAWYQGRNDGRGDRERILNDGP